MTSGAGQWTLRQADGVRADTLSITRHPPHTRLPRTRDRPRAAGATRGRVERAGAGAQPSIDVMTCLMRV